MIQVESGAPTMYDTGIAAVNSATVVASSRARNQYVRYTMMPGKKPASATPSSKRSAYSCVALCTNAEPMATSPHVTRIRAIQRRAPKRLSMRLLGTSNRK